MDLDLKRDIITHYETIAEVAVTQEETQETIVPDACPDILRIIDVYGQVLLNEKRAEEGRAIISGTVLATVLYQPESEAGIQKMEIRLPFICRQEVNAVSADGVIHANSCLHSAEARILNPRKILIRAEVEVNITAFQKKELILFGGVESDKSDHICQKEYRIEQILLVDTPERNFHFSDELRLQHTGDISELLFCCARANSVENRLIGNKLVFKGSIELSLLILDAEGVPSQRHESLPFSQVLELTDTDETADCQLSVELMTLTAEKDPEDASLIRLEMDFLAQAQVYISKQLSLLVDLYSTAYEMETEREVFSYCSHCKNATFTQNVRELLETEELVRSIANTQVQFAPVTQHREGNLLMLRSKCRLMVLYQNESQQLVSVWKEVPIQVQVDSLPDTVCSACRITSYETLAIPAAGGIEFRLSAQFHTLQSRHQSCMVTTAAQLGNPRATDKPRPSVVLRLASTDESLWDIAKTYGTTTQRILQANELDETMNVEGKMLLIPSSR